jgi:hypothetical protein
MEYLVNRPKGASGGLPRTGHLTFMRPALPGDYCVLLTPAPDFNFQRLRRHQMELQQSMGGRLPEPTHLTCNRFEVDSDERIEQVKAELAARIASARPFVLRPAGYLAQYSPLRNVHILKWQVQPDENLRRFHALVEEALAACGPISLYPKGWLSTLVTALEDIHKKHLTGSAIPIPPCDPLFTVGEVVITHIRGENDFQIVTRLPFPSAT